jgi:hypothetical protein
MAERYITGGRGPNKGVKSGGFQIEGYVTPAVSSVGAPQFAGITSWNWSAKSLEGETDGTAIENWTDRHTGLTPTQSTVSQRPTKQTLAAGPALEWDGIDDQLVAAWTPDLTGGYSLFVVMNTIDAVLFDGWILADKGSAASAIDSVVELYFASGTTNAAVVSVANRAVAVEFYQSSSVYADGVTQMVTALHIVDAPAQGLYDGRTRRDALPSAGDGIPSETPVRLLLGVGYNENTVEGYIHEIVIYEGALTEAQRDEVWDWLESEWGGPWT